MLEKWTKTSSAPSREMKPKPFSALKNFTVPVATLFSSLLFTANRPHWLARPVHPRGPGGLSPHRAALGPAQRATASLKLLPTLTFGTVAAAIWISAPVEGFRPVRAALWACSKVRNPASWTLPPPATVSVTMPSNAARTSPTALDDWPVFSAIELTSSALFMKPSLMGTADSNRHGSEEFPPFRGCWGAEAPSTRAGGW